MNRSDNIQGLTPEGINKLEKLKGELEVLSQAMRDLEGKNKYEVEGLVRAFHDKEVEITRFLRETGILPPVA
ncbi:MAG: hypothetical protein HQL75_14635 [Magnetococcales bacterium]|nr:hypothetical protein [Magnetococcales bacterium]